METLPRMGKIKTRHGVGLNIVVEDITGENFRTL